MRIALFILFLIASLGSATELLSEQRRMLYPGMAHLRNGTEPEWSDFPPTASGKTLRVSFQAISNDTPATLGLRRNDVKHGWKVSLNGKQLGRLFSDENDQEEVWQLEPGTLRDGENEIVIEPTDDRNDDIYIGQIWLDPRPRADVFAEAKVTLKATDADGTQVPCRFTILDPQGTLAAVGADSNETLAVRSGVVYSSTGTAEIGLAAGRYIVRCGRGFEYSLDEKQLVIESGDVVQKTFQLQRVVDTRGMVACDPHIHTFEISRHGDATLAERMITLAGEGIELAVATDHNVFIDYTPHLKELQLADEMTPVIGNEVTTPRGHFNIFPAAPDAPRPDHNTEDWDEVLDDIYATPNVRVAILNHARDVHSGFTPFGPENMIAAVGERTDGRRLRANAMELINSAALQSDPMVLFHDWLTLLNRGLAITAVGSSDSHEVSRKIVGQGRSYVIVDDSQPGDIDVEAAVDSFVAGRVLVSMGLLTQLTVNDAARSGDNIPVEGDELAVDIAVHGPGWTTADRVELFANGTLIRSQSIPASEGSQAGVKAQVSWKLPQPSHDLHLVAVARGPGVSGLHWPIAKPYQPASRTWDSYVFGSSGVVRVNADGDGRWTPASEYAKELVEAADGDLAKLVDALQAYDEATATFAAFYWAEAGHSLTDAPLRQAAPHIRAGFAAYRKSRRESLDAALRPE